MNEHTHNRIPVTVLTGFLGSGKTTLLKHWLQSPELQNTAVIINELGAVGLDHLLVNNSREQMCLLDNGCVCCSVREDLIGLLDDLYQRCRRGDIPPFERVVIETTGMADPLPVLQTLMFAPVLVEHFYPDAVITCVDAVNGASTLARYPESVRQASVADVLLLTKGDLAEDLPLQALAERLRILNPAARLQFICNGEVSPDILAKAGSQRQVSDFLDRGIQGFDAVSQDMESSAHHSPGGGKVRTHSLITDQPIVEADIRYWLELVAAMFGEKLLRLKGLVQLSDKPDQPLLLHAVQQVMSPPVRLLQWPSEDTRSRIVLIAEDLDERDVQRVFETFVRVKLLSPHQPPAAGLSLSNIRLR
jgi:G3E family GTPase